MNRSQKLNDGIQAVYVGNDKSFFLEIWQEFGAIQRESSNFGRRKLP